MKLNLKLTVTTILFVLGSFSAYAQTTDTDGDGVIDSVDIDDDNDGILDVIENNCSEFSMFKSGITVSSNVGWSFNGTATTLNSLVDNTEAVAASTNNDFNGKTVLQFDLPDARILAEIQVTCQASSSPLGAGNFKIQAWDGSSWIDLTTDQSFSSKLTTATAKNTYTFDFANNLIAYTKYRIFGTSAKGTASGWIQEAYFTQKTCNLDVDNDGIPNRLDLDSDGDGVPDAVEAGTTFVSTSGVSNANKSTASTIPSPYGTNGFADGLESATDNGIYKGAYTYNFAITPSIKAGIDTDGDGILDMIDIDDDNDGILDIVENNCTPIASTVNKSNVIVNSTVAWTFSAGQTLDKMLDGSEVNVINGAGTASTFNNQTIFRFIFPAPRALRNIKITGTLNERFLGTTNTFKVQGWNGSAWEDLTPNQTFSSAFANDLSVGAYNFKLTNNTIPYSEYRIFGTSDKVGVSSFAHEVYFVDQNCNSDIDNDGIPNRLDTDSDGDGCSDAVEAGTTFISTSGISAANQLTATTIPSPYGTNGFANGLETVTDNGIYKGTYTYEYITNSAINRCKDTDGDGIHDVFDIDDDNDGVLDVVEGGVCAAPEFDNCNAFTNLAVAEKNLIVNGDFNQGNTGFTTEYGTNLTLGCLNYGIGPNGFISSANSCSKGNAMQVNGECFTPANKFFWSQTITVKPNTNYIFGFSHGSADLEIGYTINNGPVVGGIISAQTEWGRYQKVINSGSSTTMIIKLFENTGVFAGNDFAIDDIFLIESNPLECTSQSIDTDNDGIPNHLDLDSDGDGCSDAVESGVTLIPNSGVASADILTATTIPAPYGTNGFANGLEAVADNGIYKGTYTYNNAINASVKGCIDTDGDGIADIYDLDDDNDGVLDAVENCLFPNKQLSATYTTSLGGNFANVGGVVDNQTRGGVVKISTAAVSGASSVGTFEIATGTCSGNSALDKGVRDVTFSKPVTNVVLTNWGYEFSDEFTEIEILTPFTGTPLVNIINNNNCTLTKISDTKYRVTSGVSCGNIQNCSSSIVIQVTGVFFTKLRISGDGPSTASACRVVGIGLDDATTNECNSDFDNDGIPNHLDLDSDNDGCSDAVEAGTTFISTSGISAANQLTATTIPSPYGTNGFANGLEAVADNGIYKGTYTYNNAINASVKGCLDTDGDGIADIYDLDDDNDGVLDSIECDRTVALCFDGSFGTTQDVDITPGWGCLKPSIGTPDIFVANNGYTTSVQSPDGGAYYSANMWPAGGHNESSVFPLKNLVVGATYKIKFYQSSLGQGVDWNQGGQWLFKNGNTILASSTYMPPANGVGGKVWTYQELSFVAPSDSISITISAFTNSSVGCRLGLDGLSMELVATSECDDDNDGIPNRLDLDSDGDGCSDAFESGASSNYLDSIISGPYGTNGYANSKETAVDNGIPNYTHTYSKALNPNDKNCTAPTISGNTFFHCVKNGATYQLVASLNPSTSSGTLKWYTAATGGTGSTTAPTISLSTPGTFTHWVSQTISGLESPRAEVKISVSTMPSAPSVIIGDSFFIANKAYVHSVSAVSGATSYLWTLPAGWKGASTTSSIADTAGTVGGRIVVRSVNNGCVSSDSAFINVGIKPLTPNVASDTVTYCQNESATALSATTNPANNNGTLKWYTSATGGAALTSAPIPSTTFSSITTYYVSQSVNGTEGDRKPIVVIVKPTPNQPNAISGPASVAANTSYSYSIGSVSGATSYTWSIPSGWSGSSTSTSISVTTNTTTSGTVSVVANVNGCSSAAQSITVGTLPSKPDISGIANLAGDSIVYCQNASATQLTAALNPSNNGGSLKWYTTAVGGTALASAPTPSTTSAGTTIYYVSQTVNGVESDRALVRVIVKPVPNQPNTISGPTSVSANTSYIYSIGSVAGATSYTWSFPSGWSGSSPNTSIGITTNTTTSGNISVVANLNGCSSTAQTLTVGTLPSKPDVSGNSNLAGDSIVYCQNATATQLTAALNPSNNGGTLKWYTTAVGGTALASAPTPSTTSAGTTMYYVSQTVSGVESDRALIRVIVKPAPNQPNTISGTAAVSTNTAYTYSVGAVTGATSYTWTLPSGWNGNSTTNTININTNNTTTGDITVTANLNGCSSLPQTFSVGSLPSKPDVSGNPNISGDSIVYCQNASANQLTATTNPSNNGGTLKWYTTSTGGTALASAPTPSTVSAGTTIFYVSQTVNSVESERAAVKIIVKPTPNQPNSISGPSSVSANTSYTYSIGSVTGATSYTWTIPNGWSGSSTTTSISVTTNTTTSGTVSVVANLNGCSSAVQTLTVGTLPSKPDISNNTNLIGDSIIYCQGASANQLTATTNPSNNGGTLKWYTASVGGTGSTTAPTPSTTNAGNTSFFVSQTVNGVESERAEIRVLVKSTPNQPNAISGNTSVTANTSYTYSVGAVSGATSYTWTIPSGWSGSSTTNSININTNSVTTGTISVTANTGNCSSAAQTLSLGAMPSNPDISGNTNINGDSIVYCQNAQTVQLTAKTNPANNGGTLKWYTTPTGGTASTTAPTPTATSAGTTIYYVSQTVNGVESNRAQIRVIVKPIPNQPNTISGSTSVTANTSFTYSVGAVTGATSYTWTIPNGWSGSSTTNSISVTTNSTTSGSISVTANLNGCSSEAQSITIGTLPNNPTSGLAGDSIVYCQNATATQLTATTNPSNNGGTLKWYTTSVGGTGSSSAPTPITTLLGTTTYYVSQTVNNVESNRTAIKVVVTNQNCAAPCYTNKPVLGSNQVFNNCPTTTADLTSVSASNQPVGAIVTWHTALPATSSNKVSNPTAVAAGVYYAIFYNPIINCYADSGKAGTSILVTITNCSKCNAGTNAPILNTFGISNVCPATSVDLTSLKATNQPAGTVLEWFSGLPISVNNKVSNPTSVSTSGTYYAIFFDATNNCYANDGLSTAPVIVTISTCPTPCNAGGNTPAINVDAVSNICPATTVNLNNITATNVPSGASLQWHTGLPASASNKVSNPSSVLGGLYYAVFFDATNNCYSANGFGVKPVQVVITNCPDPCNAGTMAPLLSADSAINNCPQTTVDLTSISANNIPNGASLQWHTALPATAGNKVANPAAVPTGTYYAIFYDATNKCFAGQGYIAKRVIASTSNCGPACNAGNFTPNVSKNAIVNTCPTTTVNLNTITASNQPKNTTLSWHTSIPASASNKIANPQSYGSQGTVYAVFYDSKNDCYNQGGNSGAEVTVVITSCPNPCNGGSENPKLSANDITNICSATTSNLSTVTASNLPNGAVLQWHTALPATASNKLNNTTSVNSGTYYAVFFDATNNCYSMNGLSGTQVLVANTTCPKCLVPANAPEIPNATIATECPATTANLNNVSVINKPRGVIVRWYTATSVSNATLVSNPSSVIEGTYYAAFYDTANNCFANNGNGNFTQVTVTLTKCCNAGNEAPKFNISTLTNICPATTVDLTAIKASNQPNYLVLEWHKSTPVSATSKVANYASVPAGTYYAVFFDPINKCYSANGTMTTPFTVSTIACNQCNAGTSSPIVSTKAISNSCPAKTADLSKITVSNQPIGIVLEWHTATPVSKTTKVEDYTKVGAGTYYAIFYDPTNACYAGVGTATASVTVSILDCNTPCNAGNVAPMLNTDFVTNNCPKTTASLSTITASNLPNNTVLQWHTATPASAVNKVADPSQVSAGTYYAVFYDAANNCYSVNANGTTPITVVTTNCSNPTKCDTFKSSPNLAKDTTVNACPTLTANLTILANSTSNGIITTWHSATPASDANRIINPSIVGAGTYYAVLYDSINKCYAAKGYATKKVTVTITNCPVCNAGNEAPIVDKINLLNICPTTSADLTTVKVSNIPRNTIVTWHTATPASASNRVSNPSAVTIAGTYYATFYDAANNCYANSGKATMSVQVDIIACPNPCASGINAPTLGSTAIKNICPAATADLSTISSSNKPASSNVILSWHTALPATDFNKVSNPSSVAAGTYYAIFYDVVNKCYAANGKATTTVTASVENCAIKCNAGTFQPFFGTDSLLNKCPLTTANLSLMVAQNQPKGTIIEWRNASGTVVANPSAVSAGIYTAFYRDTVNNCYSTGTPNPVQVKIISCLVNGPKNDYAQFDSRSKGPKEIPTALNDSIKSGSKYSIAPNGNPKKGTATIDPISGKLTYTITDTSFVGYDTVTYQLCDTITNQCSTAYVIISLSQPKDTTVSNPSNSNGIIDIDLDGNKGIPVKPSNASASYDIVSDPKKGNAIINPITGKMTYTKNVDSCGLDSVQVSRTYKFTDGRPDEVYKFWVYLDNECPDDDDIPNYISPNGDGANENFVIPASFKKKYPNLRLSVFNRWGNMVWRSNGVYQNNWGGSHFDGELLPDGVYYYIIELEDQNEKTKTGFIQVMRH